MRLVGAASVFVLMMINDMNYYFILDKKVVFTHKTTE